VDLDPQGSSSLLFEKIPNDGEPIFYDIWKNPDKMVKHAIKDIEGTFSIIPSSLENALLDLSLSNPAAQKNAVKDVCEQLRLDGYDLILIDSPPSLGVAVISAICASDIVVIPMCEDVFSLKGLELTFNEIKSICSTFNLTSPQIRILYSKYDRRVKITMDVFNYLSERYNKELITVPIRTSTDFIKALSKRETVFAGYKTSTAREDYDQYVKQLLGIKIQPKNMESGR
ncbi:MAG: ParA family protein, partial [Nitrospirae bacterium]|nr:ParA family protein [Nitrospirota bacterium]